MAQPAAGEKPLEGHKEIAEFMGWTLDKVKRHSKKLQDKGVFIKQLQGRPPNRRWVINAYPSIVMAEMPELSKQKK